MIKEQPLIKEDLLINEQLLNEEQKLVIYNSDDESEIEKKDIYQLIDGFFYSQEYIDNKNLKTNYSYYSSNITINFNKNENLFYNLHKFNINYIDSENYKKLRTHYFIDKDKLLNKFYKVDLDLQLDKNKKKIVTLSEWGYPPFGGGENWLLNISKMYSTFDYEVFIICFSDGFLSKSFDKVTIIDLEYVKIIQMPYNIMEIIKIIKVINPCIINHQGIKRIEFMKIANVLQIPFITGFCFWNNIIKQSNSNVNILENNNIEKDDSFNYITKYSYSYCASEFVNDVIYKYFNTKIDVIESISLKDDFYVENREKIYITLINCHYNKGGYLIKYLLENLNINIPLLLIYTEYDDKLSLSEIKEYIKIRNNKKNINILYTEKQDVKNIYKKTKIMLVPSLCDETFCRVAYESKMNNIPVISTSSGNLKYLLKNYAIFMNNDTSYEIWRIEIEKLYFNLQKNKIKTKNNIGENNKLIDLCENNIKNKVLNLVNKASISKYKFNKKHIGIICPWADQGLGIQSRSYYNTLIQLGYTPFIFAFRPYHGNNSNNFLQNDVKEWDYDNVYYSPNIRENIDHFEMLNFIHDNQINKMIFIETTFEPIFQIASLLKMLNIYTYLIVNIECVKISEINYHTLFDKILCNNFNSYFIMNNLIKDKCFNMGFHLEHEYFSNNNKKIRTKKNKELNFICSGGLNSISRKNIDIIFDSFYEIFNENKNNNKYDHVKLNIYIQGMEIPEKLKLEHPQIIKNIKNYSYNDNLNNLFNNDIYIHLGGQEGLGLGFYESLYMGIPIVTSNWIPNNEIVKNNVNGWLVDCYIGKIYENTECLINRGLVKKNVLKNKLINIINNHDNTTKIINNTIKNKNIFINKNKKNFITNFKTYLSSAPNLD